jgi:hypothetical protein
MLRVEIPLPWSMTRLMGTDGTVAQWGEVWVASERTIQDQSTVHEVELLTSSLIMEHNGTNGTLAHAIQ